MSPARVRTVSRVPSDVDALAVPVWSGRRVAPGGGAELDLQYLEGRGFEGSLGQVQALLADDGGAVVAVGLGDPGRLTAEGMRRAAAAAVRAAGRATRMAFTLLAGAPPELEPALAAQALVEGALLAGYTYTSFKSEARPSGLKD